MRVLKAAFLAAMVVGCGSADGTEADPMADVERVRTVNVEVEEVVPESFTHLVRVVGTVEGERDVTVAAEEGGVVEALLVRKGARVRAGQPLVRLNGDVLEAQLEQAAAQAALAEETWERRKRLWEEEQVGTEMAYLQARYEAETARAQARVLDERVRRTTVRAPVSGILDDRMVEVGSMVATGTPVARILDLDTVRIVAGIPERYAAEIGTDATVRVTVSALGGREFTGAIDFVGSAVAGDNRTFAIEVEVPNPGHQIKPGMAADLSVSRITLDSALVVPRHAVIRRESGYVAFVAIPSGEHWVAEAREVVPGVSRENRLVIDRGLESGERVIVVGQNQVADGDRLNLVDASPEANAVAGDVIHE